MCKKEGENFVTCGDCDFYILRLNSLVYVDCCTVSFQKLKKVCSYSKEKKLYEFLYVQNIVFIVVTCSVTIIIEALKLESDSTVCDKKSAKYSLSTCTW